MPANRPSDLRTFLQVQARQLGFAWLGVTSPEPPPHLAAFEAWLENGWQGEMAYLATERSRGRRADPRQILPECRSILLLAAPYAMPASQEPPDKLHGQIAAYAWGEDYHEVLIERLRRLMQALADRLGYLPAYRLYTDTGPVLERDLAQRAGLGWIGRNTCLIHPQRGSYFFLAEVLLDLELPLDPPFTADYCGRCTRCLQACPTGCLQPDRRLEARRCISYWTIELKGPIPREERPLLGNWIFGCDICQQVCPWNRRFAPTQAPLAEFAPRPGLVWPELTAELRLTEEEFRHKFRGSPVKRARRRGYLRNVAIALGNSGDRQAIPALYEVLQHEPEPLVRGHAAWALGQLGARQQLERCLSAEPDPYVQAEIRQALEPYGAAAPSL